VQKHSKSIATPRPPAREGPESPETRACQSASMRYFRVHEVFPFSCPNFGTRPHSRRSPRLFPQGLPQRGQRLQVDLPRPLLRHPQPLGDDRQRLLVPVHGP